MWRISESPGISFIQWSDPQSPPCVSLARPISVQTPANRVVCSRGHIITLRPVAWKKKTMPANPRATIFCGWQKTTESVVFSRALGLIQSRKAEGPFSEASGSANASRSSSSAGGGGSDKQQGGGQRFPRGHFAHFTILRKRGQVQANSRGVGADGSGGGGEVTTGGGQPTFSGAVRGHVLNCRQKNLQKKQIMGPCT